MSRSTALVLGSFATGGLALSVFVAATMVASDDAWYVAPPQGLEPAAPGTFGKGPNPLVVDTQAWPSNLGNRSWDTLLFAWGR